jgi:hypothetical protein
VICERAARWWPSQDGKIPAEDWNQQREALGDELRAAEAHAEAMRRRAAEIQAEDAARDEEAEVLRTLAALRDAENVDHVRAVLQTVFLKFVITLDPMVAWRRKTFPAIVQHRSLVEHGGLSITPHLRPEIVERVPGGWTVDRVALPAADIERTSRGCVCVPPDPGGH